MKVLRFKRIKVITQSTEIFLILFSFKFWRSFPFFWQTMSLLPKNFAKSVKNQNKALKSSARNLLVLAMDKGTEDEDAEQGGGTNGTQVVVEMKPLGRIDSEEAVLDL